MKNRGVAILILIILVVLIHRNLRLLSTIPLPGDNGAAPPLLKDFLPTISPQQGMAACLMVRDDNLLLLEWIAYHFMTLPLQDLVVAADLGSTQDVSLITNKWQSLINITVWNHSHFINRFGNIPVPLNDTNHHYLHRQRAFITSCAEFFKSINKTWVAFVDTDEYIVMNRMPVDDIDSNIHDTAMKQRRTALKSTTALEAIRAAQAIAPLQPCHGMPRLLYGALENITCNSSQLVRDTIRQHDFSYVPTTIRYVQHATKGAFFPSKWGKVLVDVSRLPWDSIGSKPKSAHRPFPECPKPLFDFNESILQVNHYLGSWERYSSRSDDRRSREAFEERAYFSNGVSCDDRLWEWFPRFLERMGVERAKDLLRVEV